MDGDMEITITVKLNYDGEEMRVKLTQENSPNCSEEFIDLGKVMKGHLVKTLMEVAEDENIEVTKKG